MSNLLKPQFGIQPQIGNFLKSYNGEPIRAILPPWYESNNAKFNEIRKNNNSQIKSLIGFAKGIDYEFAKDLFGLINPVSMNGEINNNFKYQGYGMAAAMFCGMEFDFKLLDSKLREIQKAQGTDVQKYDMLKENLLNELKQTNYIAESLLVPINYYIYNSKLVENFASKFKLSQREVQELNNMVKNTTNNLAINLNKYVKDTDNFIKQHPDFVPKDLETIRHASCLYPRNEALNDANQLKENSRMSNYEICYNILSKSSKMVNELMTPPSQNYTNSQWEVKGNDDCMQS